MASAHLAAQRLQPAPAFSSIGRASAPAPARLAPALQQPKQQRLRPAAALPDLLASVHPVLAALELDWSDPDTQIGAFGAFAGLALGLGAPIFYGERVLVLCGRRRRQPPHSTRHSSLAAPLTRISVCAPRLAVTRDERDEARLEELRALNRATKAETGEFMTQVSPASGAATAAARSTPPA
jgi:hypothetical protein